MPERKAIERGGDPTITAIVLTIGRLLPPMVVILAVLLGLRRLDDTDTWWHLAAGRWIVQHGTVPHTDTLSSTALGHSWTNLQWLFEVAIYGLYQAGGPNLLVLASAAASGLSITVLLANLRLTLGPVAAAGMALWAISIAQERFILRPQIISFVLLLVVVWLYATGRRTGSARLWLLPLVMLVWVNTHALFIIGAFVIACHMAASAGIIQQFLPRQWQQALEPGASRRVLLSGTAALLITLANPYGLQGVLFPLKLMSRINGANPVYRTISEFAPPFSEYFPALSLGSYQLLFILGTASVALASALTAFQPFTRRRGGRSQVQRRRPSERADADRRRGEEMGDDRQTGVIYVGDLIIFAGLAYLSLLAQRNTALFVMGATPFVGQCGSLLCMRLPDSARRIADLWAKGLALILPAMLVAAVWFVTTNGFYRWNRDVHEFGTGVLDGVMLPVRASAFVKEMKLPPPLFNDLTTGGYLAWDRPVEGGVYIDGRLEVYDEEFFSQYTARLVEPERWQAEADRTGIQTVILFHWWNLHRPLIRRLAEDRRWALVYFDEVALVFLRRDGNEALVDRSRTSFGPLREKIEENLLRPVAHWQWPVARARALWNYAIILDFLGASDESLKFFVRLLDLGPRREETVAVWVHLARYHANRNEIGLARSYLEQAKQADPTNPKVAELSARLGI